MAYRLCTCPFLLPLLLFHTHKKKTAWTIPIQIFVIPVLCQYVTYLLVSEDNEIKKTFKIISQLPNICIFKSYLFRGLFLNQVKCQKTQGCRLHKHLVQISRTMLPTSDHFWYYIDAICVKALSHFPLFSFTKNERYTYIFRKNVVNIFSKSLHTFHSFYFVVYVLFYILHIFLQITVKFFLSYWCLYCDCF